MLNLKSKKYEEIIEKNNNVIFVYYFKNYYIKYKNDSFDKINEEIFKHANHNELNIWEKLKKIIILYPSELYKEIEENIKKESNSLFIYIEESDKSLIYHLLN